MIKCRNNVRISDSNYFSYFLLYTVSCYNSAIMLKDGSLLIKTISSQCIAKEGKVRVAL